MWAEVVAEQISEGAVIGSAQPPQCHEELLTREGLHTLQALRVAAAAVAAVVMPARSDPLPSAHPGTERDCPGASILDSHATAAEQTRVPKVVAGVPRRAAPTRHRLGSGLSREWALLTKAKAEAEAEVEAEAEPKAGRGQGQTRRAPV